jgi:8-oxo-dGTP diphosphatase
VVERGDKILLIKRKNRPYRDHWALPGGFVECGESVEEAIEREVEEEAGLRIRIKRLLGVYSNPGRDPRGHVISICFIVTCSGEEEGKSDAKDARFFELKDIKKEKLAFDHAKILEDYIHTRKKDVL